MMLKGLGMLLIFSVFRDSEDFFLAAYLCLWLLLIIALAESWKQICWDKGHTYIYDKSSPKRLKKFTHLAEVLKTQRFPVFFFLSTFSLTEGYNFLELEFVKDKSGRWDKIVALKIRIHPHVGGTGYKYGASKPGGSLMDTSFSSPTLD